MMILCGNQGRVISIPALDQYFAINILRHTKVDQTEKKLFEFGVDDNVQ